MGVAYSLEMARPLRVEHAVYRCVRAAMRVSGFFMMIGTGPDFFFELQGSPVLCRLKHNPPPATLRPMNHKGRRGVGKKAGAQPRLRASQS